MTVAVIILDLRFRLPFLLHELTVSYRRPASQGRPNHTSAAGPPRVQRETRSVGGWCGAASRRCSKDV